MSKGVHVIGSTHTRAQRCYGSGSRWSRDRCRTYTCPRVLRVWEQVVTGEPIPQNARNLEEFMQELKVVAEFHRTEKRPIEYVFNETSFLLGCQGDWMEFGVADGAIPCCACPISYFCGICC